MKCLQPFGGENPQSKSHSEDFTDVVRGFLCFFSCRRTDVEFKSLKEDGPLALHSLIKSSETAGCMGIRAK